jgi:hypothetical protein
VLARFTAQGVKNAKDFSEASRGQTIFRASEYFLFCSKRLVDSFF